MGGGYLSNLFPKKTKGFTLIELLAVIVVLAIIALIAVPIVLNIIEKARRGAAISSARSYIKATETYILTGQLNKSDDNLEKNNTYNVTASTTIGDKTYQKINGLVEIKGSKPNGLEDYVTLGETYSVVEAKLTINGYEILIKDDEIISITKNGKTENIDNETITINPTSGSIALGEYLQLTAIVTGNSNKTVVWTSSDESIATVSNSGLVKGIKLGNVTITATTSSGKVTKSNITITGEQLLSSAVEVGDYVAYDAGEWTSTKQIPTSEGQFGGYTAGANKASSVNWCWNEDYKTSLKGWRVLSVSNSTVTIVHAGTPECYYHGKDSSISLSALNSRATKEYINTAYALSAHMLTYDEALAITGSIDLTDNNLREIGTQNWLASPNGSTYLWVVGWLGNINDGSMNNNVDTPFGVRPVVVLKSDIKTTGKTIDAVGQVAWNLIAP